MNAGSFFSKCDEIVSNVDASSVEKITAFADMETKDSEQEDDFLYDDDSTELSESEDDAEDFLDDDDDFSVDDGQDAVALESFNENNLANVNSTRLKDIRMPCNNVTAKNASECVSEWLKRNHFMQEQDDLVTFWNKRFNSGAKDLSDVVTEYFLLRYGITFDNDVEIMSLTDSDVADIGPALSTITIAELQALQNLQSDVDKRVFQIVYKVLHDIKMAESIASCACSTDVLEYASMPECVYKMCNLILSNEYNKSRFDMVVNAIKDISEFDSVYYGDNVELYRIASKFGNEILTLTQKVQSSDVSIDASLFTSFSDAAQLKELLLARLNHVADQSIEVQFTKNTPLWIFKMYSAGKFANITASDPMQMVILADAMAYGLDCTQLSMTDALCAIAKQYHEQAMRPNDYKQILLYSVLGIDFCMPEKFATCNYYWVSRIAEVIKSEEAIPGFIGRTIVLVTEAGKVQLLDIDNYILEQEKYNKILSSGKYTLHLLHHNAGVLIVHKDSQKDVQKLYDFNYAAQSSVERWLLGTDVGITTDVSRLNLHKLLSIVGREQVQQALLDYLTCPLTQYQRVDRCFGYALDTVPSIQNAFTSLHVVAVIRTILPLLHIRNEATFTWYFLKQFFTITTNKCATFGSMSGLKDVDTIYVGSNGSIRELKMTSFYLGLDGFVEEINMASVVLSITKGKILVNICK